MSKGSEIKNSERKEKHDGNPQRKWKKYHDIIRQGQIAQLTAIRVFHNEIGNGNNHIKW